MLMLQQLFTQKRYPHGGASRQDSSSWRDERLNKILYESIP